MLQKHTCILHSFYDIILAYWILIEGKNPQHIIYAFKNCDFIIRGSCQYLKYFAEVLFVLYQIERYLFTKELLSCKINKYSMLMRTLSERKSFLSTIALFITTGTD